MLRGERGRVAPPTVYRALDFLQAQGLVHRVESLNAFKGCEQPEAPHQAHLLICRRCGLAAEVADDGLDGAIAALARRSTFEVEAETVELTGLCADCRGG
jgi:Fur family zinc uptake transcriptional regulator